MIAAVIGFAAGIISGMGIGGGMILIPAAVFFLSLEQKVAQSVNLYYFLPTAAAALIIHTMKKSVEYKKTLFLIITGIPCSMLGAWAALNISNTLLSKLFGIFLGIFGIKEIYGGFTNQKS